MADEAPDIDRQRALVEAEMRCAWLRARSAMTEIEFLRSVLNDGLITPADAIYSLEQLGWTGFMSCEAVLKIRKACGADVG